MLGRTGKLDIVLDENAVMEDGDTGGAQQFAAGIETRAVEDDVVGLPLARRARGVHEWRILAVNGASLAVGVCFRTNRGPGFRRCSSSRRRCCRGPGSLRAEASVP